MSINTSTKNSTGLFIIEVKLERLLASIILSSGYQPGSQSPLTPVPHWEVQLAQSPPF
jgi:hypothetical protein